MATTFSIDGFGRITTTPTPDGGRTRRIENSDGSWHVSTYNEAGQNTRYENSDGARCTHNYSADGQETSYEDNDGAWVMLATDGRFSLRVSATAPHIYWAGCHKFTKEQAVRHWSSPRKDNIDRAAAFLAAVISHKEN